MQGYFERISFDHFHKSYITNSKGPFTYYVSHQGGGESADFSYRRIQNKGIQGIGGLGEGGDVEIIKFSVWGIVICLTDPV